MAHFAESARSFARSCRGRLIWLAAAAGIVLLYFLLRPWTAGMDFLIRYVTTPWKRGMSWACSLLPFSAAELCWALLILGVLVFITLTAVQIVRRKGGRLVLLFRRLSLLAAAAVSIYAGVCLLWGVNYYGKNFSDQSGLAAAPVSADQLEQAQFCLQVWSTNPPAAWNGMKTACFVYPESRFWKIITICTTKLRKNIPF